MSKKRLEEIKEFHRTHKAEAGLDEYIAYRVGDVEFILNELEDTEHGLSLWRTEAKVVGHRNKELEAEVGRLRAELQAVSRLAGPVLDQIGYWDEACDALWQASLPHINWTKADAERVFDELTKVCEELGLTELADDTLIKEHSDKVMEEHADTLRILKEGGD